MTKGKTDNSDDLVGYKKPPRRSQFQPGQSGNPMGRPKKPATVAGICSKELNKKVTINNGGTIQKKSLLEVIAIRQINQAATGDAKSTNLVIRTLKPSESKQEDNLPELVQQFRAIHAARVAADSTRPRSDDDDETEEV